MVLNVVARRRSSGGPESTTARLARSPSASLPAALSSPASGLLTQRASANASSVAPSRATTPIVARMTHSATMSRFSDAEDLARITVPTSTARCLLYTGDGRDHPRSRVSAIGWTELRAWAEDLDCLSACWASWIQLPAGMAPFWISGDSWTCRPAEFTVLPAPQDQQARHRSARASLRMVTSGA